MLECVTSAKASVKQEDMVQSCCFKRVCPRCSALFVNIRQIGDKDPQRITFELNANVCPKTCANFLHLCKGDKGTTPEGIPLHYKGSKFHRVIEDFMLQVGDKIQGGYYVNIVAFGLCRFSHVVCVGFSREGCHLFENMGGEGVISAKLGLCFRFS